MYLRAGDCLVNGLGRTPIVGQRGDKAVYENTREIFSLQHLLDEGKGLGLDKCLREVPNAEFLPG
jgi:hypothetical protein